MSARGQQWRAPSAQPLAAALRHAGFPEAALAEGRVFVEGRRARSGAELVPMGARVELRTPRVLAPVRLLERRGGLLAVDKPWQIATEPDGAGAVGSLTEQLARQLGGKVHALTRLDVGVSGVVLCALDAESARHVERQRAAGALRRRYVALAARAPTPPRGGWQAPLRTPRGLQAASTGYALIAEAGAALLALEPHTGRRHQLRLHAAHAGAPLLGDRAKGGPGALTLPDGARLGIEHVALHAAWVELRLPDGALWRPSAPPSELETWWRSLGGAAEALGAAQAPSLALPGR